MASTAPRPDSDPKLHHRRNRLCISYPDRTRGVRKRGRMLCSNTEVSRSKVEEKTPDPAVPMLRPLQQTSPYLVLSPPHIAQHSWLAVLVFTAIKQAYFQGLKVLPHQASILGWYDRNKLHPPCRVTPELQLHNDANRLCVT